MNARGNELLLADLDGTLIDRDSAFRSAVSAFCGRHDLAAEAIDWVMQIDAGGFTPRNEVASAIVGRFPKLAAQRVWVDELLDRGGSEFVVLDPAVRTALLQHRATGRRIVIVTNGRKDQQERKLIRSGLHELVDAWVISEDLGARKPDPAIFHAAAGLVGAELLGAWMIGDSAEADIQGAHDVGCRTAWVTLGRTWTIAEFQPTVTGTDGADALNAIV